MINFKTSVRSPLAPASVLQYCGTHGDVIVTALYPKSSGLGPGSIPGRGHSFLDNTLYVLGYGVRAT